MGERVRGRERERERGGRGRGKGEEREEEGETDCELCMGGTYLSVCLHTQQHARTKFIESASKSSRST